MIFESYFLLSLLATLIVEIPIVFLFLKYIFKIKRLNIKEIIIVSAIASTLTLPYLWFILPAYIKLNYYIYIGELLVVLIEALIYNQLLKIKIGKALLVSFIANLISFLIGFVIF